MRAGATALVLAAALAAAGPALAEEGPLLVRVPAGAYLPFYKYSAGPGKPALRDGPIKIRAFRIDRTAVTNAQFADFVRDHPEWRRSQARSLFVDQRYLENWPSDLAPPQGEAQAPATHVSWFAAQGYCEARGLRLPTTDEWEYALNDEGRERNAVAQVSLDWFGAA